VFRLSSVLCGLADHLTSPTLPVCLLVGKDMQLAVV
jgi:hypothetical protein